MLKVFDILRPHRDRSLWYMRGQANATWPLTPSLVRLFNEKNVNPQKSFGIEMNTLREFQSQAHLHIPRNVLSQMKSDMAWLMLMQHYSCPTRLLDWTLSPFIATYFAVEQQANIDGAVWFFQSSNADTLMTEKYGSLHDQIDRIFEPIDAKPAIYPIVGMVHTERSAAQQAVYTLCLDIIGNHDEIMARDLAVKYPDANGSANKMLNKIVIPATLKNEFLSRLLTMNIKAQTLFPGADGIGRSASEIVRLRVWAEI